MPRRLVEDDEEIGNSWLQYSLRLYELWGGGAEVCVGLDD